MVPVEKTKLIKVYGEKRVIGEFVRKHADQNRHVYTYPHTMRSEIGIFRAVGLGVLLQHNHYWFSDDVDDASDEWIVWRDPVHDDKMMRECIKCADFFFDEMARRLPKDDERSDDAVIEQYEKENTHAQA